MKYGAEAEKNGVYVVGACGWDSIPCDLGINYIKEHFNGTLAYAETFVQTKMGEAVNFLLIITVKKESFYILYFLSLSPPLSMLAGCLN